MLEKVSRPRRQANPIMLFSWPRTGGAARMAGANAHLPRQRSGRSAV